MVGRSSRSGTVRRPDFALRRADSKNHHNHNHNHRNASATHTASTCSAAVQELHACATSGDAARLRAALLRGAHVEARDASDKAALHIAAYHNHAACVEALLEHGADPNSVSENRKFKTVICRVFAAKGRCPFGDRCHFAHGEAQMRRGHADEKSRETTPLEAAIKGEIQARRRGEGGAGFTRTLGMIWDASDATSRARIMHRVCKSRDAAQLVVQFAVELSAHGLVDCWGWTLLHHAAHLGSVLMLRAMLDFEPGLINAVDSQGKTALHRAAQWGRLAAVEVLLQKGADQRVRNAFGMSALEDALRVDDKDKAEQEGSEHRQVVRLLSQDDAVVTGVLGGTNGDLGARLLRQLGEERVSALCRKGGRRLVNAVRRRARAAGLQPPPLCAPCAPSPHVDAAPPGVVAEGSADSRNDETFGATCMPAHEMQAADFDFSTLPREMEAAPALAGEPAASAAAPSKAKVRVGALPFDAMSLIWRCSSAEAQQCGWGAGWGAGMHPAAPSTSVGFGAGTCSTVTADSAMTCNAGGARRGVTTPRAVYVR